MKNRKYLLGLVVLPFLAFCTKDNVESPAFDVSVEAKTYKVNDSVRFSFTGTPDIITFYSGEKGKEYQYKDRTIAEGGKKELNITTQITYGSQTDNLRLMASTDFKGVYDSASVKKATWTDITSKFKLSTSPVGVLGTNTTSGKVDISDVVVAGQPLFLAFKYVGLATTTGTATTQRGWRIYNFDLTNTYADGTVITMASRTNAGWTPVNIVDAVSATGASKWVYIATMFYYDPMSSLKASEGWYITKPFLADNISPDKGVPIKEYSQRRSSYAYAFTKPGVYKVSFVASNSNYTGQKSTVKEFEITVVQ